MPKVILRAARAGDAEAISRVLHRSYSTLYRGWYRDDVLTRALPAMTRANPVLIASGRYFVGEVEGEIIACGGWSAARPGGGEVPRLAHLRHFGSDPDYMNRGAGGTIVGRCLTEARASDFHEMEVISSLTAEAFYARHGFVQVAMVSQKMGGAEFACVLMRRPIGEKG